MASTLRHRLETLSDKLRSFVVGPDGPRTWLIVVWYACLTYSLVFAIHYSMWSEGDSQSIADMLSTHQRVIDRVDIAPVQYRYVAYALPELLHQALGISVSAAYGLVRMAFTG